MSRGSSRLSCHMSPAEEACRAAVSEKERQEGAIEMLWAAAGGGGNSLLNLRSKLPALRKQREWRLGAKFPLQSCVFTLLHSSTVSSPLPLILCLSPPLLPMTKA